MLYEKQVARTNGFGNTASNVGQLGLGCKPEIGWLKWKYIERLQGSSQDHWEGWRPGWDASQLGSQPKAPTPHLAWLAQPSPLHTDHGTLPLQLPLEAGCFRLHHWQKMSLAPVHVPKLIMLLISQVKVTCWRDGCIGIWKVLRDYLCGIFYFFEGVKFCFLPRLLRQRIPSTSYRRMSWYWEQEKKRWMSTISMCSKHFFFRTLNKNNRACTLNICTWIYKLTICKIPIL